MGFWNNFLYMDDTANPFLYNLRLPVKQSSNLYKFAILLHVICLITAWVNSLTLIIKIVLSSVIGVSFSFLLLKNSLYKADNTIDSLILNSEDHWQVMMLDGAVYPAILESNLFVHPWLTVISLSFYNRRQYFVFTPEVLDSDTFRRLRVRLRMKVDEQ